MRLKVYLFTFALVLISASAAFAGDDCKNGKFAGSYTRSDLIETSPGVTKNFVTQYNFGSEGNVIANSTVTLEQFITSGTGSPLFGSWGCTRDGHIIVTILGSNFVPDPAINDIVLLNHYRTTSEYVVVDKNTLQRIKVRSRTYTPSQDPGDPTGGTPGAIVPSTSILKRVIADADELNP